MLSRVYHVTEACHAVSGGWGGVGGGGGWGVGLEGIVTEVTENKKGSSITNYYAYVVKTENE